MVRQASERLSEITRAQLYFIATYKKLAFHKGDLDPSIEYLTHGRKPSSIPLPSQEARLDRARRRQNDLHGTRSLDYWRLIGSFRSKEHPGKIHVSYPRGWSE